MGLLCRCPRFLSWFGRRVCILWEEGWDGGLCIWLLYVSGGGLASVVVGGWGGGLTVVGRAEMRRVDCSRKDWAVGR